MIIHRGYKNLNLGKPVVTLGVFDGVHRGHHTLLNRLVERARETNSDSVVITFAPHPRLVLEPLKRDLFFLTTMEEKMILLEKANINHLIIIEFTKAFSNMSACDFIMDVLVQKVGAKHLLMGYNHHFGRKGEGDLKTIKQCTESLDLTVEQIQGFYTDEGAISSSLIRDAILRGRLDEANSMLGYYYSLSGTIVEGYKIGRSIGFPTANIKPNDNHKLIPCSGVYAVEVKLDGLTYPGMLSIGSNPTVNTDKSIRSIEVHILNFENNIYGRDLTVVFRERIRDEVKFETTEQLSEQMKLDKVHTLRLLG